MTKKKTAEESHDQTNLNDLEEEVPATESPPPSPVASHGFLEQFEHLSHASFESLKEVVESGLQTTERVMLMKVALKLFAYSVHGVKEDDFTEEQKSEVETLIFELESTLNLNL